MVASANEDVTSVNDDHSGGVRHRRVHLVHAFFPEVDKAGFNFFYKRKLRMFYLIFFVPLHLHN